MLAGNGRNALHAGQDAHLLTALAHLQVLFLHVAALGLQYEAGYLEVREATLLHLQHQGSGNVLQLVVFLQLMLQVNDVLQALQEPLVNLRQLLDALDGVTLFQSLCNGKDAQVGGVLQSIVQIVELCMVVAYETVHALANHAQTFLNHLLERATDGHDFAYRLHAGAYLAADTCKLGEVPAGNLTNHVVQRRSNVSGRGGAHLANLVERVAQGNLGSDKGEGIARSL